MRHIWQHISSILSVYDGKLPLAHFLKGYFKQHPKLGSRDRRWLSAMIYSWYRCSKGILPAAMGAEEKIAACLQLCKVDIGMSLPALDSDAYTFNREALFSYPVALSAGIDRHEWLNSMLTQPDLFIRVRKNRKQAEALLTQAQLPYRFIRENCLFCLKIISPMLGLLSQIGETLLYTT
jgi:16S rRNA (cytosine967-C5)-methyltransferase